QAIEVAVVVDRRTEVPARWVDLARRLGAELVPGGRIVDTIGRLGLRWVRMADRNGRSRRVRADLLAMAGGWNPALGLTCHLGGQPVWNKAVEAFVPGALPKGMLVAGPAAGRFGLEAALEDGAAKGAEAAEACGRNKPSPSGRGLGEGGSGGNTLTPALSRREREMERNAPIWLMGRAKNKAFVDFQNDVTTGDVVLAYREGFRGVEHLKRYTTLGMATDQGKLANVNGLALMAELTGRSVAETGTTRFRPPHNPVSIGALAGPHRGRDFRPTRLTPAHAWAEAQGAVFTEAGLWLRASYFPRPGEDWLAATDREVVATRNGAGVCDVSTLGKIELTGPDVGAFLDRLYVNTFSTLKPGRVRYGLMLREDGFAFDDGTVARLGEDRWVMTTTTANAGEVLAHMEHAHQVLWPGLDVQFTSVTDQWAQFSIAGPRAREVLAAVVEGDVSDAALPYMGCAAMTVLGGSGRVFRISFSGERAYEVAVPARRGEALARAIVAAGAVPYGVEALSVMRIEKGHPAGGELNGQTTARDLGMARMMSTKKDFIGRALASRPALVAADRPGLVGVRPVDPAARLRAGAHFLPLGAPATIEHDQGWMSSAAHSPSLGWIGLGFLAGGAARHGDRVRAYDPVRDGDVEVEVVPPCFLDPEGALLRG
ncbi:MAG TPA: sarcosine oxidase subunit alpha, partial [Acetobacteraceae bacterium]|nr:sarcosine oxidase subunit alpha [Acetobacteraceae bacterium]